MCSVDQRTSEPINHANKEYELASFDLSYLSRLTQRVVREGTSIFIRTYDDAALVHEFEFTNAPLFNAPNEVPMLGDHILCSIAMQAYQDSANNAEATRQANMATYMLNPSIKAPDLPIGQAINLDFTYNVNGSLVVPSVAGTTDTLPGTLPGITPGVNPGAITSGTATLYSLCRPSKPAATDRPACTLVESAGVTGLGSVVNFFDNPDKFETLSAPFYFTAGGSGIGKLSSLWAWVDGGTANTHGAAGRIAKWNTRVFRTNSDVVDIGFLGGSSTADNEHIRIRVDGALVNEAPMAHTLSGSSRKFTLTIAGGIMDREICIETSPYFGLQYAAVPTGRTLYKPTKRGNCLAWFGDSFEDSESPSIGDAFWDLTPRVGTRLGFRHVFGAGSGGTSYALDSSSGGRKSFETQLTLNDISVYTWDAIAISNSYNAVTNAITAAAEAESAGRCWRNIRAKRAEVMLIVGPWYRPTAHGTKFDQVRSALFAAFLAWGDFRSYFIDPYDGSITRGDGKVVRAANGVAWFNANNLGWTVGPDGAHPTPAGVAMLEDELVSAFDLCLRSA